MIHVDPGARGEQEKPTPGPWVVKVRGDHTGSGSGHYTVENPTYEGPCPCGARHPPGALIAWLAGGLGDADVVARTPERARCDPQAKANANLIAAAPRMLLVLKRAAELLDCMDDGSEAQCCRENPCPACRVYADAEAVIASAEGR